MNGAQVGCFFWINVAVCIVLIVAVVRIEIEYRCKIKRLEETLDDPAMKDLLALRLRIKHILKKHGVAQISRNKV